MGLLLAMALSTSGRHAYTNTHYIYLQTYSSIQHVQNDLFYSGDVSTVYMCPV